jgi:hypothetical protein
LPKCGVRPPEPNAAFVAHREEVVELYQRPDAPRHPLGNMEAKPVQLLQETRPPWPAKPGKPQRYDDAYERVGTANVFLLTEPLPGWRRLDRAARRTAVDGAYQSKPLRDDGYPEADKLLVVCANRHTHQLASRYEAVEPKEARRLARRLEIHDTPKHGSWLHRAEIALRALTKPCLERRRAAIDTFRQETKPWEHERNAKQTGVDWQLTPEDARLRLKRLYPQSQG